MFSFPGQKTKIVCTVGPSCRSASTLSEMILRGMSVARLNLAHGTAAEHGESVENIRKAEKATGRTVAVLADLPGPKIRVGTLPSGRVFLEKNDRVTLAPENAGEPGGFIPVSYLHLAESVRPGNLIYMNDGYIELQVLEVRKDAVLCRVNVGGELLSGKGLNLPGASLSLEAVTDRDLALADTALGMGIDTFGISFVKDASDVDRLRRHATGKGKRVFVIAKIERREAVDAIDGILDAADGVMVARGDLGVEVPIDELPLLQKKLIRKANLRCRPVITATQMLKAMEHFTRPTRAEVADVANAVLDGTDALMLSEETAVGQFPVETVEMMARIARSVEGDRGILPGSVSVLERLKGEILKQEISVSDMVSLNAAEAAEALRSPLILTPTTGGNTPRRISRFKPGAWIVPLSGKEEVSRFLAFSHGVFPLFPPEGGGPWTEERVLGELAKAGFLRKGDRIPVTEGKHRGAAGGTDSLGILTVS
ncbi:MAG TPA: pyruvate kinase [Syntrophales bacterium]|nr:pyruvate kinase [Syntrophales bacterium]